MARNKHRIAEWGLGERVDWLIEEGLRDPSEIAKRLNEDPQVAVMVGRKGTVMKSDIEFYMEHRLKKEEELKAKALAHSPKAAIIMEQAQASLGRLIGQMATFEGLAADAVEDLQLMRQKWRQAVESGEDTAVFYDAQVRALKDLVGLIEGLVDRAQSPAVQAIVKANTVNQTVNQGIDEAEVLGVIKRMAKHLKCPNCSHREFSERELLGVYGHARAAAAEDDVIDADTL